MAVDDSWTEFSQQIRTAHDFAWGHGMPGDASALYSRWWQLETWLRSLVYVERTAKHGRAWANDLPSVTEKRERSDQAGEYMASPDAHARLAYLDAGPLFTSVIADDWDLYAGSLLDDLNIWRGRSAELLRIRHRIGHCRRPHADDLNRVEQLLRDLEPGAFKAISSYNEQVAPESGLDDSFVAAWVRHEHDDASRLVDHALNQYDIAMRIRYSRRPWAPVRLPGQPVSGSEGYLWHVGFVFRGGRPLDLQPFWTDHAHSSPDSQMIYLTATDPFNVEFSFSAVDDPIELSDEVGHIFDRIITNRDVNWVDSTLEDAIERSERWKHAHQNLDARVQVATGWSIVDRTTTPITLFGA